MLFSAVYILRRYLNNGVPPLGGVKEGWGVKIQRFSSFKRQYLENAVADTAKITIND